ncbi:hypothetical protein FA002_02235 [Priestia megaterium]|uniref:hypothetical protein n=1 Tax=Priestia megaterium TaxID=1404 RepID=UPI0010ACC33D|nr:hypothetical protein [Priestia megaterium]TJZ40410.1 hypothetical protein FA002_02235 [Priestia megaterium]
MITLNQVKSLRENIQGNFSELAKPYHQNNVGFQITRYELSDRDIRAGLDVWSDNREIYVTENGWDLFRYEDETNSYQYTGAKIINYSHTPIDDEKIVSLFNEEFFTENELAQFTRKYNEYCR